VSFDVDIGWASERGTRSRNEDFCAALRDPQRVGVVAALADGVSSGGRGLEAAQTTVASVVGDFFSAPATWETTVTLDRLISAQNAWLADHNRRRAWSEQHLRRSITQPAGGPPSSGPATSSGTTTLTALVLQGQGWTLAHVGDSRAWLLRGPDCLQLTQDHAFEHADFCARLTRAVGLDERLLVDYEQGELQLGDCFVLTSDGVHNTLSRARLAALAVTGTAQEASQALVAQALAEGSADNASALVLRVRGLAAAGLADAQRQGRHLPVPRPLKLGDVLDGYTVTALVANTGLHRLVQAREQSTGALVAIKTLHESRATDPEERAMLAHEAWLGQRAGDAAGSGTVRVHTPREPSAFYVVFDWHSGRTMEQLMSAAHSATQSTAHSTAPRVGVAEVVSAATALARAVGRLHRLGIVHRDIKPANLHCADDGRWRILDLGAALSGRESALQRSLHAGTPSYMNPEQWGTHGAEPRPADPGSDLFALGVTLYQWLTGVLPYGEIEPFQVARYRRDPLRPSRRRPDVPIWLDHVLLKAIALDPAQRFETAEELVLALDRGASRSLSALRPTPLIVRDRTALWKIGLVLSLLFNALLVVWLLFLPK
jgi:serine/threonine protein phosphatase PrpC